MTGPTHRIGGLTAGLLIVGAVRSSGMGTAALLAGAVLGSLLPDIDNRRSSISCRIPLLNGVISTLQMLLRLTAGFLPGKVGRRLRSLAGHRGVTHSLLLPAAFAIPSCLIGGNVGLLLTGLSAGAASHILLDLISGGVPLLLPLSTRRLTLARIKTGGGAESVIRVILAVAAALLAGVIWGVCL